MMGLPGCGHAYHPHQARVRLIPVPVRVPAEGLHLVPSVCIGLELARAEAASPARAQRLLLTAIEAIDRDDQGDTG